MPPDTPDDAGTASTVFPAMGTVVSMVAHGPGAVAALTAAAALVAELEALLSRMRPDSEISALNRSGARWTPVDEHTDAVLAEAAAAARRTGGAYDPTIGALVDLWDIRHRDPAVLPDPESVRGAALACGHRHLERDELGRYRLLGGAGVDLGGIAKGYAADRVVDLLRGRGITSALVSLGGSSVAALGTRPDGSAWRVGLRDALADRHGYAGVVRLADRFLSTSGDYEQYVVADGRRYHHILDVRTGYPSDSDLRSVTVVADSGTLSEAYSTALLVMGLEASLAFHDRERTFEAVFVTADERVLRTPGVDFLAHRGRARSSTDPA